MVTDALLLETPTQLCLAQSIARQVLQLSSFSESKAGSSSRSFHFQMAAARTQPARSAQLRWQPARWKSHSFLAVLSVSKRDSICHQEVHFTSCTVTRRY